MTRGLKPEILYWKGQEFTRRQLANLLNVSYTTLCYRIKMHGVDRAVEICQMSESEYENYRSMTNEQGYLKSVNRMT